MTADVIGVHWRRVVIRRSRGSLPLSRVFDSGKSRLEGGDALRVAVDALQHAVQLLRVHLHDARRTHGNDGRHERS